jgi:pSer/pThr/pTyr-binding forkhead associated (FHA) protein
LLAIALLILRYVFLLLLFVFIFRLVKWMIGDLGGSGAQKQDGLQAAGPAGKSKASGTEGSRFIVVESSIPELKPGDSFSIGREIFFGRGGRSDIIIMNSFTSTQHARVYLKEGQYWLEDLKSTNGTLLNEVQVKKPIVLANGDRLRVGGVTFQFVRWGYEMGSDN